ncbi:MAG: hypothetical protein V3R78_00945, partial [Thermodesulfobacteriota bacterium]
QLALDLQNTNNIWKHCFTVLMLDFLPRESLKIEDLNSTLWQQSFSLKVDYEFWGYLAITTTFD